MSNSKLYLNHRISLVLVVCILFFPFSMAAATSSEVSTGSDKDAILLLTEELRQLRAALNHSMSVNSKTQILFERTKLQSEKVFKLKQAIEKLTDDIEEKSDEINKDSERVRAFEVAKQNATSSEKPQPDKNELIEILAGEKLALERLKNKEFQYRAELLQEETKLGQLSDKIETLEQDVFRQ